MILAAVRVLSAVPRPPHRHYQHCLCCLPQIYPWLSTSIPFIVFLFNAVIHAAVALSKRLEDQNWIDRYYLILGV